MNNTPTNTPEALAPEYLADLLTNLTGTQWEWEHTGGGCMALIAHLANGTYAMITDEGLSDEIAPTDPVSLGIYPDNNEHYDEPLAFHNYPTIGRLISEIFNPDTATKGWCNHCQMIHEWYWCHHTN